MDKKKSFLLYTEQKELLDELSHEQAGILFKSIYNYVLTGEVPELDALSKIVFISIRQNLDRNDEKYNEVVEKRKIAGRKGGKKSAEKRALQANSSKSKQIQANQPDNDNVNVNVNVNDNVNDNVLSLNAEKITKEEREILRNYISKQKRKPDNPDAYMKTLIKNGDWEEIVETEKKKRKMLKKIAEERKRQEAEESLSAEEEERRISEIHAKFWSNKRRPSGHSGSDV